MAFLLLAWGWFGRVTGLFPHHWRLFGHVLDARGEMYGVWHCRKCFANVHVLLGSKPGRKALSMSCDEYLVVEEVMNR
jgi:hypothetical protein